MRDELETTKKRLKSDTIFVGVIIIIITLLIGNTVYSLVKYGNRPYKSYQVQLKDDEDGQKYYTLLIDGMENKSVDYNEYSYSTEKDENSYKMPKAAFVADEVENMLRYIFILGIILDIFLMFLAIQKNESPFQKKTILYLRIAGFLTICAGIVPIFVKLFTKFLIASGCLVTIKSSMIDILVFIIAILIFMVSEIFSYGYSLQKEQDLIA